MADLKDKVDKDGIRLAPSPLERGDSNVMPAVRQEFIITPRLDIEDTSDEYSNGGTELDFQPRKEDASKRRKRRLRAKNMAAGVVMLLLSIFVLLQYLLPLADVWLRSMPFRYIPTQFGAVINLIDAFKFTSAHNWRGDEVNALWLHSITDILLAIGILCILINVIKSLFGLFGAVRPQKYVWPAAVYLAIVVAILIASLVGVGAIGLPKVDFVNDIIRGYRTSELFGLIVIAIGYFLSAVVVGIANRDKGGYMR